MAKALGKTGEQRSKTELYCLGATKIGKTTSLGSKMSEFPLRPELSRMLIAGADFICSQEVVTLVAMIETRQSFFIDRKTEDIRNAHLRFFREEGDLLTLLEVFNSWKKAEDGSKWCQENFISIDALYEALGLKKKLVHTMERLNLKILSADNDRTRIQKAIVAGWFMKAATWDPESGCYRTLIKPDQLVHLHSESAIGQERPNFVVYSDILVGDDSKDYMIGCTAIEPEWLIELGQPLFSARNRG